MTRREFISQTALASAGALAGGCAATRMAGPNDLCWGVLLHLGSNMWADWSPLKKYAKSAEEAEKMRESLAEFKGKPLFRKNGSYRIVRGDYLAADIPTWNALTEQMGKEGLNLVLIDVGEAYCYPSHPELWVNGGFSPDRMRAELKRLRGLGLEPIPKLNFSAGHDQWLRQYHYMTSTRKYYQVVADLIKDVCEVFDNPRYFHLGFDEETTAAVKDRQMAVLRQGDLWWHDFNFCVAEVEKHGARATMSADYAWEHKDEYFRKMSKRVLQGNWYYGAEFDPSKMEHPEYVTTYDELEKHGFDQFAGCSNIGNPVNIPGTVKYCREHVSSEHLKGFQASIWRCTCPQYDETHYNAIDLLTDAVKA